MTKVVSASEFKATCLKLIDGMQKDGAPVTITKRGRVVAELKPHSDAATKPLFGSMKGTFTAPHDVDLTQPIDPDWEAKWEAKWDRLGFPIRKAPEDR
jgi:antitoxin (DNA-binding transcriptional repressor) of toxin-antitoxin stability system